jgi:hypothetical protein
MPVVSLRGPGGLVSCEGPYRGRNSGLSLRGPDAVFTQPKPKSQNLPCASLTLPERTIAASVIFWRASGSPLSHAFVKTGSLIWRDGPTGCGDVDARIPGMVAR